MIEKKPSFLGKKLEALYKSPDLIEWEARNNKGKEKAPPKKVADLDPVLVDMVQSILRESPVAISILHIAEQVAVRMKGTLPPLARLYPTHPDRIAICEVIAAHTAAELDAMIGSNLPKAIPKTQIKQLEDKT